VPVLLVDHLSIEVCVGKDETLLSVPSIDEGMGINGGTDTDVL
jgi:hypothetical protein